MPICKHCKVKLTSWHNFRVHILTSCPVLHAQGATAVSVGSAEQSAAGPTEEPSLRSALQYAAGPDAADITDAPVAERSEVLALLPQQNWKSILWLDGVKEHLRNHCILCAQWVSSAPGALNKHLFSLHPAMSRHSAEASAQSLTLREGQQRPCGACGARPLHRTKHKCRVLYQICLLRQSHLQALTSPPPRLLSPAPQNGTCSERGPERLWADDSGKNRRRSSRTSFSDQRAKVRVPRLERTRSPKPVVSGQGSGPRQSPKPGPVRPGKAAAPAMDEEGMGGMEPPGLQLGEDQPGASEGAGGPQGGLFGSWLG